MRNEGQRSVRVVGGGPAGSAAALTARRHGAEVRIVEKTRTARHKVCGEFISSEACQVIDQLGAWDAFRARGPARITRCRLHFGRHTKQWKLAEPAFGLSRLELDRLLLDSAAAAGAEVRYGERWQGESGDGTATILAGGRSRTDSKPDRLFAFKSHFDGPSDDAVELYFGKSTYIGVSPLESGMTNVCGIASESELRRYGFDFDEFTAGRGEIGRRVRLLTRRMPWLSTGPLVFSNPGRNSLATVYPAGDALGFVDPFTGSGIYNALLTGRMAGAAAASGLAPEAYVRACRRLVHAPFAMSGMLRKILEWECAGFLAAFVPGTWLYRLTRAAVP